MSPFREPPAVELGPLEVGLGRAARRAMMGMIPSGGRLIAPAMICVESGHPLEQPRYGLGPHADGPHPGRPHPGRPHAAGILGSLGLVVVGACALVARAAGWELRSAAGTGLAVVLVIAGGLSLAAVLRAVDAPHARFTLRGDVVGRAARRALRRAQRLAGHAARCPERFGPRRVSALRKTLAMMADPLVIAWIPADVRGRTELLLARALAASAGLHWSRDPSVRAEVRALLLAAERHLAEPEPARSDLRALLEREDAERFAPERAPRLARRALGPELARGARIGLGGAPLPARRWAAQPPEHGALEDALLWEDEGERIEEGGREAVRVTLRR